MRHCPFLRRLPALIALLAVLLAFAPSLPATADPGDPPSDPSALSSELQAVIDSGMSAHAALGHMLFDAGPKEIAQAYCSANLDHDTADGILKNAGAANSAAIARLVAGGHVDKVAEAFAGKGDLAANTTPKFLLNALRFWMWREPAGKKIDTRTVIDLALQHSSISQQALAERLTSDYPWDKLPASWSKEIKGRLEMTPGGVRMLTVWGSPFERGYAHGRLLGRDVLELWSGFALRMAMFRQGGYRNVCEVQDLVFDFPEPYLNEMKGLMAGILDSVPEADRRKFARALGGRDVQLVDLKAGNTLSDWAEFGCSSVTVWGDHTTDGRVLTGRNLDYQTMGHLLNNYHLLLVEPAAPATATMPARKGWVSLAFTGAIGCYTGMNEDGVTAMMHNTPGHYSRSIGIVPRGFSQRYGLERADAARMPESYADALREMHHLVPSNIHVSWPRMNGKVQAQGHAAAMELDGYAELDHGVTVRQPASNGDGVPRDLFVVTNHFCQRFTADRTEDLPPTPRRPVDSTERYTTLEDAATHSARGSVDVETVREWLRLVSKTGTAHSVVFSPDTREIYAMQPTGEEKRGGPYAEPQKLSVPQLLDAAKRAAAATVEGF